jgi:hypothetical protein
MNVNLKNERLKCKTGPVRGRVLVGRERANGEGEYG